MNMRVPVFIVWRVIKGNEETDSWSDIVLYANEPVGLGVQYSTS